MTAPGPSGRPRGALVTGAGRGIGRGIAHALAREERDVIVADVDLQAAEECARELRDGGWSARAVELDVTDADMIGAVIRDIDADTPLATVVNNAGVAFRRPTVEVSAGEYDRLMAINVRGVFFVLQAALRAMVPRGEGSVVNISSTSGFTASTGPMAAYDASKAAVRMLTQAVAREVAPPVCASTPWLRGRSRPT